MGLRAWLGRLRPGRGEPRRDEAGEDGSGAALEHKLRYRFRDPDLLNTALTHRSHVFRAGGARLHSNERLEFLGDSVLGLIVNEYLFRTFPARSEG